MKIAIPNNIITATLVDLKSIASSSLLDMDMQFVVGDGCGYIYCKLSSNGDFQPDDASGNMGWWSKSDKPLKLNHSIVLDSYDFGSNSATDITSINNFIKIENYLNDYGVLREYIKGHVTLVGWSNFSDSDKDVIINYYAHLNDIDKVTHLMTARSMSQYDAESFLRTAWRKHNLKFVSALIERWIIVPTIVLKYLNKDDAEDFFDTIRNLHYDMVQVGNLGKDYGDSTDGVIDYTMSTNGYIGTGLRSNAYTLLTGTWSDLENELKDCIVDGNYSKLI